MQSNRFMVYGFRVAACTTDAELSLIVLAPATNKVKGYKARRRNHGQVKEIGT